MKNKNINKTIHLLFVCGRNKRRSRTAQQIYSKKAGFSARSAGVSDKSTHTVSERDLLWSDIVFVFEAEYSSRIMQKFGHLKDLPPIRNLDIPDKYQFMDQELIHLIQNLVEEYFVSV